jgi:hypothetical protein
MKILQLTLLLLFGLSSTSRAVDFEQLVKNPSKFDGKRITLVAIAEVGGDRFYFYRPPKPDWSKAGAAREIYGVLRTEAPVYDQFNDKWVKVTGTVDAKYRGLGGDNACSLNIERVRLARETPEKAPTICNKAYAETQFPTLISDPNVFDHKCVDVTGFAHVIGDAFVIYESEKSAEKPDFKKGIFVSQRASDTVEYDRYNNRWIRLRGVVDMNQRGFADYPCGITVDKVQPTSPPNASEHSAHQ